MVRSATQTDAVVLELGPTPNREEGRNEAQEESVMESAKRLIVCFLGIFLSYLVYALVQEKISKSKFGDEQFRFFGFLVFTQCIVNATVAGLACIYFGIKPSLRPRGLYSLLACSCMGSMLASNSALAYINYPMQVLGKSCKPIPGILIGNKRYHCSKFFNVLLIVAGVSLFMFTEHKKPHSQEGEEFFLGYGEILLLVSLTLDGTTGALQERLKSGYTVTPYGLMFAVNAWSIAILGAALFFTEEYGKAFGFISRHPEVVYNLLEFGITSAVGQIFIYHTITHFGPLTCSIITTTRKFFTILASVLIYGHSLLYRQWMGVALVFMGLSFDIYFSNRGRRLTQVNGSSDHRPKEKREASD